MSKSNGAAPTDTVAKEVLANGKAKSDWETATELTSRKQYWHFDCYPTQINVFISTSKNLMIGQCSMWH